MHLRRQWEGQHEQLRRSRARGDAEPRTGSCSSSHPSKAHTSQEEQKSSVLHQLPEARPQVKYQALTEQEKTNVKAILN